MSADAATAILSRGHCSPTATIMSHAVRLPIRFTRSHRDIEEVLAERPARRHCIYDAVANALGFEAGADSGYARADAYRGNESGWAEQLADIARHVRAA